MLTRRELLLASAATPHFAAAPRWKLGAMDGVLGLAGKAECVAKAAQFGLEGLQVTLGRAGKGRSLPLSDPALQKAFVAAAAEHKVPLVATYIDILHTHCLKSDPIAQERVVEGIEITRKLGAKILMLVFFGSCALEMRGEIEKALEAVSDLVPTAERAGVVLGFENLLPAGENIRALEKIGSPVFKIYYDIGNATNVIDVDPAEEIRRYGRGMLCQVHLKDRGYLGEGKVNVPKALDALEEIGYDGHLILETGAPSKNIDADLKRNVDYLRGLRRA